MDGRTDGQIGGRTDLGTAARLPEREVRWWQAWLEDANDTEYLDTLVTMLIESHRADPSRIYMTGLSHGAITTFK